MRIASAAGALAGCWLVTACLQPRTDRGSELDQALQALAAAGYEFEADVRFRSDRYGVCQGLACADLRVERSRRTITLAPEAFSSDARLRATLLEIWGRYREPRSGSVRDLARSALRVLQEGPRVGIRDVALRRLAHHTYRQLYERLSGAERQGLPDPETLPFP
ncbi:MAG: hypothetical protein ACE5IL_00075 [Myxococcota bacterium]